MGSPSIKLASNWREENAVTYAEPLHSVQDEGHGLDGVGVNCKNKASCSNLCTYTVRYTRTIYDILPSVNHTVTVFLT